MRDYDNIKVVRGVSHLVAPRDPRGGLTLSQLELPLDGDVQDFLASHVVSGLGDSQAQAANFVVHAPDRAADVCRRILESDADLVELSTLLARRLHDIALGDGRQKDGTFVTLLCSAEDGSQPVKFVAMLKLDPSDAFHSVTDTDPQTGKTRVRFELNHGILPVKSERLQKSAFARVGGDGVEYELLAVDRLREAGTVGRFWLQDFLGCEPALDPAARTRGLYRALRRGRNQVEADLSASQVAALDQVINGVMVQRHVRVDDLISALPIPSESQKVVSDVLHQALPDREFDLDEAVSRQFLRRKRYRADNDLTLSVGAEFQDMIQVLPAEGDDPSLRRVVFETRTWKEI